jgi:hypothetical protein
LGEKRRAALLLVAALILTACFFVAPATWAGGDFGAMTDGHLVESAFRAELVASWQSADQTMTQGLIHLIDYWRRYHGIKIVIGTGLLAVLVALSVSRRTRALRYLLGALALCALMLVMVNIQATAAPLTALLQALPMPDGADMARTYGEIGQGFAGQRSVPVLEAMIVSYGRYHAVMAVETAVVAVGFVGCSAWAWRGRRAARVPGTVSALLAVGLLVATVASARMSLDAVSALPPYFAG